MSIGSGKEFIFIEARMLHWPDSMMCYLTGDNILFSNDAFGQHYATEFLFNDLVDQPELYNECIKYYANILTPFSSFVVKKINEVLSFKLPVDMICTSHGVIWRRLPTQIISKYLEWANDYQENQITIIYDTMWEGTRKVAEKIADGIKEGGKEIAVKIHNSTKSDKNDIITDVFRSKMVLVGSPTINRGILNSIAGLLEEMRGLEFKNKKACAFGCYGWSGESNKMITEKLEKCGFSVINEGFKALWNPDEDALNTAKEFGKDLAVKIKS